MGDSSTPMGAKVGMCGILATQRHGGIDMARASVGAWDMSCAMGMHAKALILEAR